jgi:enamine deaminase RidA (YjgF/YER057c/UK114 family)
LDDQRCHEPLIKSRHDTVRRRFPTSLIACFLLVLLALPLPGQRKKKKGDEEPPTQTLEVLPDPPPFVTVETEKIGFVYSPLSAKGLLSQQTRDALKALQRLARGAQIVKVRAFVAGSGDQRRVPVIVSEVFSEKKQPLPAVSVVQVGLLPLEGAQVLLEATLVGKRGANPHGLAFFSGQQVASEGEVTDPLAPVLPLVEKSLAGLNVAASGVGVNPTDMLRVTCLVSSLTDHTEVAAKVSSTYPQAATTVVQLQRGPLRPIAECEAVARLTAPLEAEVKLTNPPGLTTSANYSQVALVNSRRLVLTGEQMAFGAQDADVKLAFDRLGRVLTAANVSYKDVFFTSYYPLTASVQDKIRAQRFGYLDKSRPPASTMILFEGLPSVDASFGMNVIAAAP